MKFVVFLTFVAFVQSVYSQGYVNPLRKYLNKDKEGSNPAVKVQLTAIGLNYAASIAAELMAKKVYETKIDDISGKKFVKYSVKNIKIDHFRKPTPDISMIPGHGIKLNFKNAALSASGRWRYKKAFVRDSGSVKVYAKSISIGLSINILVDSNGRPKLQAHTCNVNLGGFNIKLRGGASFLYNLLFKAFKGKTKSKLQKSICNGAIDAINNNGNSQLATLNMQAKISEALVLDYFLTGPATFTGTYLETSHRGMFLEDPEKPKIPLIGTPSNTMIAFSIAAEAFNSAGRIIFAKNLLSKEFDIPAIKKLLVSLDPKFSTSNLMVKISPSSAPKITIVLDLFTVNLQAQAELIAQMPDGSLFPVMTVDVALEATAAVEIKDEKIILQLTKIVPKAKVTVSHIGQITSPFLDRFLEETIKLALPVINEKLKKGFPLPNVKKTKFPNASIKMHQGYLNVASDIIYNP